MHYMNIIAILTCLPISIGFISIPLALSGEDTKKEEFTHKVVVITKDAKFQPAESSVAINPTNPDHIVAVSLFTGPRISNASYVSKDGGKTWKTSFCPNPAKRIQGDDAVAFDADGVAHHTYISFTGIRLARPRRAENGIFCSSSHDGLKWSEPTAIIDHVNTVEPFEDKPFLGIDLSPTSKYKGNIYVAWTKFDVYGSKKPENKTHIYMSRSTDGGKSFSPAWRISDKAGTAKDDSTTVEGAVPAVGPNGEVYIAWSGPEGIVVDQSTDGGVKFGKDVLVSKHPGGWDFGVKGLKRHNGMPVTGADISKGEHRGSVYVMWLDKRNNDPDVFLAYSRDQGKTWSDPVRVNDDKKGNGKEQLFAWMAVDPVDGSVNIVFYDRRDTEGTMTGLTLARSTNGGKSFRNYKVDQKPFDLKGRLFFGDYLGISAYDGRVVAVYPHYANPNRLQLSAALFRFKKSE